MVSCLVPVGFANQAMLDKGNTTFWSLVRGNEMVHHEQAYSSTAMQEDRMDDAWTGNRLSNFFIVLMSDI
jgi:hypothetical protein